MAEQTERAFRKQPGMFAGKHKATFKAGKVVNKKKGSKSVRWWRNPGLGFKVPKEAIEVHTWC